MSLNTLIDNGWMQSIIGGLIVTGLIVISKKLFAHRHSYQQVIFSVTVASIVFCFGVMLQSAAQVFIEGDSAAWKSMRLLRDQSPGVFVFSIFLTGILAGIPTGLAVLKGTSFKQRVAYGAIWAPFSLTVVDIISHFWYYNPPLHFRGLSSI